MRPIDRRRNFRQYTDPYPSGDWVLRVDLDRVYVEPPWDPYYPPPPPRSDSEIEVLDRVDVTIYQHDQRDGGGRRWDRRLATVRNVKVEKAEVVAAELRLWARGRAEALQASAGRVAETEARIRGRARP